MFGYCWRGIFPQADAPSPFAADHGLKLRPYAPAIMWGAFLLFLGGRSDVPAVETDLPLDKAAHFLLYGVLGWLAARGWLKLRQPAWYGPLVFALLVGAADELHQRSVANRSSDVRDWLADVAGIGLVYTLLLRRDALQRRSS